MPSYKPADVERQWQQFWETNKTFRTPDPGDPAVEGKPKHYILDMFPYPSGAGLHVGHPEGYTAPDILARFKRMNGFHVLHPMGWDAYGLPAEQYAVKTNTHPRVTTRANIETFRRQIKSLGFSYDWDREVDTTDPDYYKWTQWIFLQLHKAGKAYKKKAAVNWCPFDKTVLADIGPGLDNVAFVNGRIFVSHITGSIHEIVEPGKAKPLIDKGLEWPLGLAVGPDGTI